MTAPRATGFPRKPSECKRHRLLPVMDLSTGKFVEPRRYQCWHCGASDSPEKP